VVLSLGPQKGSVEVEAPPRNQILQTHTSKRPVTEMSGAFFVSGVFVRSLFDANQHKLAIFEIAILILRLNILEGLSKVSDFQSLLGRSTHMFCRHSVMLRAY